MRGGGREGEDGTARQEQEEEYCCSRAKRDGWTRAAPRMRSNNKPGRILFRPAAGLAPIARDTCRDLIMPNDERDNVERTLR